MTIQRKGKNKALLEIEVRERENEALSLRRQNWDYGSIAEKVGWANESVARHAIERALRRFAEPDVQVLRAIEDQKLRELERRNWAIVEAVHYVVDHGKVIFDPITDTPLTDDGPVQAALKELRMIQERRAKLLGLDAPMRLIVEEIPEDSVQAEVRRINAMADAIERDLERKRNQPA